MYYDRQLKEIKEQKEYQEGLLKFLYNTIPGRFLLKNIVVKPWLSEKRSKYQKSSASVKDIKPFIKKYNVLVNDNQINDWHSFNDFFTRKKDAVIDEKINSLISVADSKILVYQISDDTKLKIKNSVYSVSDIIKDDKLAAEYKNGTCLVFRLSVDDYHRYHYPDSGSLILNKKIPGVLHTVRPISDKYKVYSQNSREVNVLDMNHLGKVIQIEVGALMVGKIVNHGHKEFEKGQEKGYFEFGGSTIVLLLKENAVILDDDIIKYSQQGIETKVFAGEKIGTIKENNKNV